MRERETRQKNPTLISHQVNRLEAMNKVTLAVGNCCLKAFIVIFLPGICINYFVEHSTKSKRLSIKNIKYLKNMLKIF